MISESWESGLQKMPCVRRASMTHLAMSERDPNKAVQWLDPVTEAEYKGAKK